jgi:hypothetical protein
MRKIIIAAAIPCLLLLAQCGMERGLTPWSAPTFFQTSGTMYVFQANSDHQSDGTTLIFMGYEVYYKIGLSQDAFSGDTNWHYVTELAQHGFKRLFSSTDTFFPAAAHMPLIVTDNSAAVFPYEIYLDFTNIGIANPSYPKAYPSNPAYWSEYELRRNDHYLLGHTEYGAYKKFYEFYNGDTDIPADAFLGKVQTTDKGTTISVWIALYVYAYGKSISSNSFWTDITSPLCYLNANNITVIYHDGNY